MNPALEAHLRLLHQLPPERIRTHQRRDDQPARAGYGSLPATRQRRALIREWWREGIPTDEMRKRLNISQRAVQMHLKALRAEARRA